MERAMEQVSKNCLFIMERNEVSEFEINKISLQRINLDRRQIVVFNWY